MAESSTGVPNRPPDKVLVCPECDFRTFDEQTARDHYKYKCGAIFGFVEKAP